MNQVNVSEKRDRIIRNYLGDMIAVMNHTIKAVERQIGDKHFTQYPEAHGLLGSISGTLRRQMGVLEQRIDALGGDSQSVIKKAVASTISGIAKLWDTSRYEDPVSRGLRDDHTALTLTAMSYSMLHTTSHVLNDPETTDLTFKHLSELMPLLFELTKAIPGVVAQELALEDKAIDLSRAEEAIANVHTIWAGEVR